MESLLRAVHENEFDFLVMKMKGGSTTPCCFSDLKGKDIDLQIAPSQNRAGAHSMVPYDWLFDLSTEIFPATAQDHIGRLYNFLNKYSEQTELETLTNGLDRASTETLVAESRIAEVLARKVIKPLAGDYIVGQTCHQSWKKKHMVGDPKVNPLGLGKPEETWYGYLDMVAVPGEVPVAVAEGGDEEDSCRDDCCVEFKRACLQEVNHQLVGETICFSFVQRTNNKKSIVPGLLVNKDSFSVVVFDCEADILLISKNRFEWRGEKWLGRPSIVVLWSVLHHGKYLRLFPEVKKACTQCRFGEFAKRDGTIKAYETLSSYKQDNVNKETAASIVHGKTLVSELVRKQFSCQLPPAAKKEKTTESLATS